MKNNRSKKLPSTLISRNLKMESIFGIKNISYYAYESQRKSDVSKDLIIVGQIFSESNIKSKFWMALTFYDTDGDVIESIEADCYGNGWVTNCIKPEVFFDGFPFEFHLYGVNLNIVSKIELLPTYS